MTGVYRREGGICHNDKSGLRSGEEMTWRDVKGWEGGICCNDKPGLR